MAYSTVTKPSVGDPIKLSTIEGIIDNQEHFQSSIAANTGFNADGSFESAGASGSEPALGWTEVSGNALTIERSNTSSDPNIHGEYTLKFSGSFGQTGGIESGLFPVSELELYELSITSMVDNIGDSFKIKVISYERDGTTSVQTVTNPYVTNGGTSNEGLNHTSGMTETKWMIDTGTDSRFAKVQILFTVNSSIASAGYTDQFTFRKATAVIKTEFTDLNSATLLGSANSIDVYCPKFCTVGFFSFDTTNKQVYAGGTQDPISTAKTKTNWELTNQKYFPLPNGLIATNYNLSSGYVVKSVMVGKAYNSSAQATTISESGQTAAMSGYHGLALYYFPETIL